MFRIIVLLIVFSNSLSAMDANTKNNILGSAYSEGISYKFLGDMCRTAGGRLSGSPSSKKALAMLNDKLHEFQIKTDVNTYKMPGWERGRDYLRLIAPFDKEIRAYCMGYSSPMQKTIGDIIYAGDGYDESYNKIDAKGKFAIVQTEIAKGKLSLSRNDAIKIAANHGAVAVIFIGAKDGGMVLVSVANFTGDPTPIPAFSITKEDGTLLIDQIKNNITPRAEAEVTSKCKEIEIANLRAIFPGKSDKKVLLLAHYDSWDISTGAVDNGVGTAVLLEIARLIKKFNPNNYYTIECIWTDAEEIGLYGAKKLAERVSDSVVAVINMDMPGSPTGIDIMGYENLQSISENFLNSFTGYKFDKGVKNEPWINSDHSPFMIKGIPAITFYGFDDPVVYKHYHDFGDTFDKVNPKYMSDAAAIIGLFGLELANYPELEKMRLNKTQTIEMLKKHKLDEKLKRQGEWIE